MSEWIKCVDRLPEWDEVFVLAYGTSEASTQPSVMVGYFKHGWWFELNNGDYIDGGYGDDYKAFVTHWQPLPAPPTE